MKTQYLVLAVLGAIAVTSAAMAGGYFLLRDDEVSISTKPIAVATQPSQLSVNRGGSGQLPGAGNGSAIGDTQGFDEQSAQNSQTASLPGPESFSEYEQYAGDQTVLYVDIEQGTGQEAAQGDSLAVVYVGWLTNGTIFDQSRQNEQGQLEAFTFQLGAGQVIRGWDQGVEGMRIGGRRRLIVPASVGYGSQEKGAIPPNSMLIFDVELVQVQTPPATQPGL